MIVREIAGASGFKLGDLGDELSVLVLVDVAIHGWGLPVTHD